MDTWLPLHRRLDTCLALSVTSVVLRQLDGTVPWGPCLLNDVGIYVAYLFTRHVGSAIILPPGSAQGIWLPIFYWVPHAFVCVHLLKALNVGL